MRIITGNVKGLHLKTAAGLATRPTSDRVKESLFSILNGLIDFPETATVLDIFAGTGALGLESLSRGANSATFIDTSTNVLLENIRRARFQNCKVLRDDFRKALRKISAQNLQFDLVFSDPPYASGFAQISANLVAELNLLTSSGLLIVEHGAGENLTAPDKLELARKISYGHTTAIDIFQPKGSGL
ncbi:MAG: 16S rRNA (guanine(966)-N(2))-methyltransferase RsmD [Selenomonadaceae bacterium]|nr:16S rRNA (guanine(966)-N(2))-methyltransferase RsmD [Selenomonadaceae bacterium]